MAEDTLISWAHHTFNPWIGCTIKSLGCKFCYAKTRWADQLHRVTWGPKGERSLTSIQNWRQPLLLNARAAIAGTQERMFCASLADVFDDHPSIQPQWRTRLWDLIAATPNLEWLLLTKRPENWLSMLPTPAPERGFFDNVRLGVSIEDQPAADERLVDLQLLHDLGWPTFVSYGPAIGPVDWAPFIARGAMDWMVAEGESGDTDRPTHPDWMRSARDACVPAGIPFHFKQWGTWMPWQPEVIPEWRSQDGRYLDRNTLPDFNDADLKDWTDDCLYEGDDICVHERVGKKNAGRSLDGVIWNQFPAPLLRSAA